MNIHRIPQTKINEIRRRFIRDPKFNKKQAAIDINVSRHTINVYVAEFRKILQQYPDKLRDKDFFLPVDIPPHRSTEKYLGMLQVIPSILKEMEGKDLIACHAYVVYRRFCPDGYSFSTFKNNFFQWCEDHQVSRQRNYTFPCVDIQQLGRWRSGNDHQKWQIAVALLESLKRKPVAVICSKIEANKKTVLGWLAAYKEGGLEALERKKRTPTLQKQHQIEMRTDNLIYLLQQSPKTYGLNRTSWKLADLVMIYERLYGESINIGMASRTIRREGYRTKKSREQLTSPDPLFREKFAKIQDILAHLAPDEKFFSIDEYGPVSIRAYGGRSYVKKGETKTVPLHQKVKSWLICTAALELSSNQVTHFYSPRKETAEMIKLIERLVEQYRGQRRLYLSWDAASWHDSKQLKHYIENLNSKTHRKKHGNPEVIIAPLPSCSQHLNVIESVFGGLARAIIHHSDYQSDEECKAAIDRYFADRNTYFQENPKRAGKIIWGKELVEPVFKRVNKCRNTGMMTSRL